MGRSGTLAEKLTSETDEWTPNLDIVAPIYGSDIKGFSRWVKWNGFSENHKAYDFAAYIDEDGRCVLGLPSETPIRSIADGVVRQISQGLAREAGYATFINIEHAREGSSLFSCYCHVDPLVINRQPVKKGDTIATLYKDTGDEAGRLVHLHFELANAWSVRLREADPAMIFDGIDETSCSTAKRHIF